MSGYAPIRDQFLRFGDLRPQGAGEWRGPLAAGAGRVLRRSRAAGPRGLEHVGPVGVTIPGTALGRAGCCGPAGRLSLGRQQRRASDGLAEDWLVIADQHADPLILECPPAASCTRCMAGRWDAQWLAPDCARLAAVLAAVGGVHEDAGDDLCDDEGELRPGTARPPSAAAAVLGGDEAARASSTGWNEPGRHQLRPWRHQQSEWRGRAVSE